jgi:hypothetical protein
MKRIIPALLLISVCGNLVAEKASDSKQSEKCANTAGSKNLVTEIPARIEAKLGNDYEGFMVGISQYINEDELRYYKLRIPGKIENRSLFSIYMVVNSGVKEILRTPMQCHKVVETGFYFCEFHASNKALKEMSIESTYTERNVENEQIYVFHPKNWL